MVARTLSDVALTRLRAGTADAVHAVAARIPSVAPTERGGVLVHRTAAAAFLELGPNYIGIRRTAAHIEEAARDRVQRERSLTIDQDVATASAAYRDPMALAEFKTVAELRKIRRRGPVNTSKGKVVGWSRRSRARMAQTLGKVDWTPLFETGVTPAMVTFTLPDRWEQLAPTPADFKRMVDHWKINYRNAWGESPTAVWKLEFQLRGAPHLHVLMTPPEGPAKSRHPYEFDAWLAHSWADVVGEPDPAERAKHLVHGTHVRPVELEHRSPSSIGDYFSKHGMFAEKGYQNEMPDLWRDAIASGEPGTQFWGAWRLKKAVAVLQLDDRGATAIETCLDPLGLSRLGAITLHYVNSKLL